MSKKISLLLVLSIVFANIICECPDEGDGPEIDPEDQWSQYAYDVWLYTNKLRQDPDFIRDKIQAMLDGIDGNRVVYPNSTVKITTNEGANGQREAIDDLNNQEVLCPLSWSKGMTFANIDHVKDAKETYEKKKQILGHNSSNGGSPWARMDKYGRWGGRVGENLSYGASSGMNAVIQLYIDDGVLSRGHRKNLTNPHFKVMGAAAGELGHKWMSNIMTQNFAKTFNESPENYPSTRRLIADETPGFATENNVRRLPGQDNVLDQGDKIEDRQIKNGRRLNRKFN